MTKFSLRRITLGCFANQWLFSVALVAVLTCLVTSQRSNAQENAAEAPAAEQDAAAQDQKSAEAAEQSTQEPAGEPGAEPAEDPGAKPAEQPNEADPTPEVDPGQDDLDEAAILRFDAKSNRDLEAVKRLLNRAIKKGLTGENLSFAKEMLGSVLLKESQQMIGAIAQARGQQAMRLRDQALQTLDMAIEQDPELVEALLLKARVNMLLPGGDKDAVYESTSRAIEILKDDPAARSEALVMRALTYGPGQEAERLEDLDAAIKDNPENIQALQARAAQRLRMQDVEAAMEDLESVLAQDPTNQIVAQEAVNQLIELNRMEDAIALMTKALEAKPSEGIYRIRAILNRMSLKEDEAMADFNRALAMQPKDPISLLQRAEISIAKKDVKSAKDDLQAAIDIAPQVASSEQAIFVRCLIAIEEERMADAINDMKELVSRDPSADYRQLQLANLYLQDDRLSLAIEPLSVVIDRDPKNINVLRIRADTYLALGDHANAIADYERAVKSSDDDTDPVMLSGILNNLAWVLATSPKDDVRNGKRSLELAEKAVELTEAKEAHILSTLAAAYAEVGNFEKAIEWSTKAVEQGKAEENEQLEQLEQELKSYQDKKPWREKQETEENAIPILSPDDLIDT